MKLSKYVDYKRFVHTMFWIMVADFVIHTFQLIFRLTSTENQFSILTAKALDFENKVTELKFSNVFFDQFL